jgi:hypothetical protein
LRREPAEGRFTAWILDRAFAGGEIRISRAQNGRARIGRRIFA